jgi:hypothetical protein
VNWLRRIKNSHPSRQLVREWRHPAKKEGIGLVEVFHRVTM